MRKLIFLFMTILLCSWASASAQTRVVNGTVVDGETNEPLVGVTVMPVGGGQGVATDADGRFSLRVPDKVKKATFSYVGYTPRTLVLTNNMEVKLISTSENLDDLVVIAYGQQKKSSITGSVSQVKADEIKQRPVSSVTSALEGTTSGITVSGNYGSPGESPTILIRGIGTVNGSTSPLYVIDGVPFGGNISDLNPDDIESMSVLKDAASTALYGNRASNGVILITTKKAKTNEKIQINFRMNQGWYERGIAEYDRLGAHDWMDVNYQLMLNNRVIGQKYDRTSEANMTTAHNYVKDRIISNWTYSNPFNVDDDKLFTTPDIYSAAGVFDRSAEFLGTIGEDLDWWKQATRNGYRGEYTLNAMGATSKSDYMFSMSYLKEDGYMRDNDFERITGRANVNIQPLSWLKSGLNVTVTHQKIHGTMNGVGDGSSSYNNAFYFCRYMSPIYPVHEHDYYTGEYVLIDGQKQYASGYQDIDGFEYKVRNQNLNRNVIWESELNTRQNIRNTMNGTAYADFILPYGFTVKIQGNLNTRNTDYNNYTSAVIGDAVSINGSLSKTMYTYKNYTFMQQLHWNMTYGDRHHINALLAHENYAYRYDYTYTKKANQGIASLPALSNFALMQDIAGYMGSYRTESYLARVQYNYADRYNVEASFRRDGSSRFARKTRWGNFGSVGANWVFSNEPFMESASWLNQGKLFANWGQVGNDQGAGYYSYMMLYGLEDQAGDMASVLTQLPSDKLKWETSETWGIGLEGWLFDRLHLSIEYYNKMNKDLIFNVTLPSSVGSTSTGSTTPSIATNIGNIRNQGIEIATDVDIFKNKDWKINVGANLSFNENKVTKLPDWYKKTPAYNSNGKQTLGTTTGYYSGIYRIQEGHSRYDVCYYHYEGVDMMDGYSLYTPDLETYYIKDGDEIIGGTYKYNEAGQLELDKSRCSQLGASNYRKINGKYYVINTTYAAKQWAGDALPKVYGSFNANIKFKGFKVAALFTYSLGGKIYDSNYASLMSVGSAPAALSPDMLNSWTKRPEGMTADSPDRIRTDINPVVAYSTSVEKSMWGTAKSSPTSSYQSAGSDRWLISRNYLCFKNLNVSYDLPKSLLSKIKVSGASVSFSAENLFISTKRKGMNPMMGISATQSNYLVPARVYSFGLSLNL